MSSTPREIGTLIVVILRANHLPNKKSIGKQDPYCLATVNGEKRRTKAIKRGGQHPEWDEEIRFTLFEDVEDVLARTARGDAAAPLPPPKDDKKNKKIKGGKTMKLACYADDPREPELIGETEVDLTEVLTKGETDDWFTLSNKDKFAGKVYIELTFWSNEPPPEKKVSQKPPKNKQYGGPGSFVPSGGPSTSQVSSLRTASASFLNNNSRRSSDVIPIPSSLRASTSLAGLDLYVPPYERNQPHMNSLVREFNEFGVSELHPASFPPVSTGYSPQTHTALSSYPSYDYGQSMPEATSPYSYDRPLSPNVQIAAHQHSPLHSYPSDGYLQNPYEMNTTYQPTSRGPRHSTPTASSGFMLLPQASGFVPSHISELPGFPPPHSHTPAPTTYNSQHHPQPQVYAPPLSHTPIPANNGAYLQQSTSLSFHPQQPFPASQSFSYPSYGIPPSASAPPQQFLSSPPPAPVVPQAHSAPPHMYPTSPSQDEQLSQSQNASRPLPQQPQVVYTQPALQTSTMPQPGGTNQLNTFGSTPVTNTMPLANNGFGLIPPPPPPPILQYNANAPSVNASHLPIPPPPPVPFSQNRQAVRRASLPQPPTTVIYQPPPPPPPPSDFVIHNVPPPPPPLDTNHPSYPGHPPKPPVLVDEHGQSLQSTNTLSSGLHSSQGY